MKKYKAIAITIVALAALPPLFAQKKESASQGQKLVAALVDLKRAPADLAVQKRYLESFPRRYVDFVHLFEPCGQLYDGWEYISILSSLAAQHERSVGQLLVELSKDAHYEADAPGYLQQAMATYASLHTKVFVELVKQLAIEKRVHLIVFLADVENYSSYPAYQDTIDHLRKLGENCLAQEFEAAREQRLHVRHDQP